MAERTTAARSGDKGAKIRLGVTCLGGPYQYLPPDDDHGKCGPSHSVLHCGRYGYRNTKHINWEARNSVLLIDIDNITGDREEMKLLFDMQLLSAVAVWVSAGGKGLKVGVAVDHRPEDTLSNYDAWAAVYQQVVKLLSKHGLKEREDYSVDSTPAAAQMAILAHDPRAVVRSFGEVVPWVSGERHSIRLNPRYRPRHGGSTSPALYEYLGILLTDAHSPAKLASLLPWSQGSRSTSMFHFGIWAAYKGFDWQQARAIAFTWAHESGMVREYGLRECLRHFDRGHQAVLDDTIDFFPIAGYAGGALP